MKKIISLFNNNLPPLSPLHNPDYSYSYDNRVLIRHSLNLSGCFVICLFSNLQKESDIKLPLLLMCYLKKSRPDCTLLIVGDGPMLSIVAATCEYDDLMDCVFPLGNTNNPGSILSASDAILSNGFDDSFASEAASTNNLPLIKGSPELDLIANAKLMEDTILSLPLRT